MNFQTNWITINGRGQNHNNFDKPHQLCIILVIKMTTFACINSARGKKLCKLFCTVSNDNMLSFEHGMKLSAYSKHRVQAPFFNIDLTMFDS